VSGEQWEVRDRASMPLSARRELARALQELPKDKVIFVPATDARNTSQQLAYITSRLTLADSTRRYRQHIDAVSGGVWLYWESAP
jgi:hypothetical protein